MAIYQNIHIKPLSEDVFSLDKGDSAILYKFAILGESTRHKITTENDKKTVSKRIDILFKNGFLILRKSTPFHNQPHKSTKYFGLSLKGLLVSLRYCNVEDNYLTKKFLKEIKNKSISKLVLQNMKNDLFRTLYYTSFMGITLDKLKNIHSWLGEYHELAGLSNEEQVYFETLDDVCRHTWNELREQITNKSKFYYVTTWYSSIDNIANGVSYSKIMKDIDEIFDNIEPIYGINVNESYQNVIAKFMKEFKMDLTQ